MIPLCALKVLINGCNGSCIPLGLSVIKKKKNKQFKIFTMTANYELIREAIIEKKSITCMYKNYLRKMTPHVIGTKNGSLKCLFYQYGGESKSGLSKNEIENWRCTFIDEITDIEINNDQFATASNHSKTQSCVDEIDVETIF